MVNKLIQSLTESIKRIPTISKKNAESISFFLLENKNILKELSILLNGALSINSCVQCMNLTNNTLCKICTQRATSKQICVVKSIRDLVKIESSKSYDGKYHILGVSNIGYQNVDVDKLVNRIKSEGIEEIILAIDPDVEGEILSQTIANKIINHVKKLSKIALGIPFGGKIEVTDSISLANSIKNRGDIK